MNVFNIPRFVVFEGVDGTGKTTMSNALEAYYRKYGSTNPIFAGSFPGKGVRPLGDWVYRLQHGVLLEELSSDSIAPAAMQVLHLAAHIDQILCSVEPTLREGGCVILDRYWWSTYAYSRLHLDSKRAWSLIRLEEVFWDGLIKPVIVYLSRKQSLKPFDLNESIRSQLSVYYDEVIQVERSRGARIYEISTDCSTSEVWESILEKLGLPLTKLEDLGK